MPTRYKRYKPRSGEGTIIYHPHPSTFCKGVVIGRNCRIHSPVWIGEGVRIGDNVKVQAFSFIPSGVTIGDDCFIGPSVVFTNDKYPPSQGRHWGKTVVEDGAVIGGGARVLPGLTIGAGALIGAGAVVTKSVPSGATVVGNPARELKRKRRKVTRRGHR